MAKRKPPTPPAAPTLSEVSPEKADTSGQDASATPDDVDVLSAQELRFVTLSASGESMDAMAVTLGVCSRTLRRWKRRPEVASAIAELTRESMATAKSTLANAANKAARELVGLSESATPDASRVSAARAILEHAEKFVEIAEISDRLTELEAAQAKQAGKPGFNKRKF
jgi:transposase-like protein